MLEYLHLSHFRNLVTADLNDLKETIVLYGLNGAGKTNVLEAVSHLTAGKGLRSALAVDQLLTQAEDKRWSIRGDINQHKLKVYFNPQEKDKRQYFLDDICFKNSTCFSEHLNIVWYTPAYDFLFTAASAERRRFVDKLTYTFVPSHSHTLNRYEHLQRERMKVLQTSMNAKWLEVIEESMANEAYQVIRSRQFLIDQLNVTQVRLHDIFPKFNISLSHSLCTKEEFQKHLFDNRMMDKESNMTKFGPHRHDIITSHSQKNMQAALCSTGEQKMLFLAILFSYIHARLQFNSTPLLLLLDEIVSHLDFHHRMVLFSEIAFMQAAHQQSTGLTQLQVWMSGTDEELFKNVKNAVFFRVEHGSLEES